VPAGPVFMAWLSDCQNMNADTVVHPYCVQWVKEYTMMQFYRRMRDPLYNDFVRTEEIERRAMRRRIMELDAETIINLYEQEFGPYE